MLILQHEVQALYNTQIDLENTDFCLKSPWLHVLLQLDHFFYTGVVIFSFHGGREGKVKKTKQKKCTRGETKSFVEAEKGAEIRLACICSFQFFGDIKGKQGCEAGEKKS